MDAYHLTAIDVDLRRRVSLGFFSTDVLAAEVRNQYANTDMSYRDYRVEQVVIEGDEMPVILIDDDR